MQTQGKRYSVGLIVILVVGLGYLTSGWSQPPVAGRQDSPSMAEPLVGPAIDVEGRVRRRKGDERWKRLRHSEPVFLDDVVRTGGASHTSILLERYHRVETLGEYSEAHFFRGASQCETGEPQRQITLLRAGILWVVANAIMELRTANTLICVRGTSFLVHFTTPPDTTEIITLEGSVVVRNLHLRGAKAFVARPPSRILVSGAKEPVGASLAFPDAVLEALLPEVGSNPQTDTLTPDTSPAAEDSLLQDFSDAHDTATFSDTTTFSQ